MFEITIKCDECKAVKQEANHWWVVIQATGSLTIKPWSDSAAKGLGLLHICGRECLQKAVSQFTEESSERTNQSAADRAGAALPDLSPNGAGARQRPVPANAGASG